MHAIFLSFFHQSGEYFFPHLKQKVSKFFTTLRKKSYKWCEASKMFQYFACYYVKGENGHIKGKIGKIFNKSRKNIDDLQTHTKFTIVSLQLNFFCFFIPVDGSDLGQNNQPCVHTQDIHLKNIPINAIKCMCFE